MRAFDLPRFSGFLLVGGLAAGCCNWGNPPPEGAAAERSLTALPGWYTDLPAYKREHPGRYVLGYSALSVDGEAAAMHDARESAQGTAGEGAAIELEDFFFLNDKGDRVATWDEKVAPTQKQKVVALYHLPDDVPRSE